MVRHGRSVRQKSAALGGIFGMLNSAPELLDHLSLALLLEESWEVRNRASVVRALVSDFAPGRREHCRAQLLLANLAAGTGWSTAFEEKFDGAARPLDVTLRRGAQRIPIEVKGVLMSDHDVAVQDESQAFNDVYLELLGYDVFLRGEFSGIPSAKGRVTILEVLRPVAIEVQRDHVARSVRFGSDEVTLVWAGAIEGSMELSMPVPFRDDAVRMLQKIQPKDIQASGSGTRWLHLEMLGTYFYLSPWVYSPFLDRVDTIVADLASAPTTFDGVVVTSGRVMGIAAEERIVHPSGAIGLLRQVSPMEVRTSVIRPLTQQGIEESEDLALIYELEGCWLDRSLERFTLPPAAEILAAEESRHSEPNQTRR